MERWWVRIRVSVGEQVGFVSVLLWGAVVGLNQDLNHYQCNDCGNKTILKYIE